MCQDSSYPNYTTRVQAICKASTTITEHTSNQITTDLANYSSVAQSLAVALQNAPNTTTTATLNLGSWIESIVSSDFSLLGKACAGITDAIVTADLSKFLCPGHKIIPRTNKTSITDSFIFSSQAMVMIPNPTTTAKGRPNCEPSVQPWAQYALVCRMLTLVVIRCWPCLLTRRLRFLHVHTHVHKLSMASLGTALSCHLINFM